MKAAKNHKGQTAADVRAERIQEARGLALGILEAVELAAREQAPAAGWHWGHAGDWGHVVEQLQDGHGAALILAGATAAPMVPVPSADLARTFLRVRDLLTGATPAPVKTYPVQRNGRTVRVTIPANER